MPHDVFISYPHQDKTTADAACARLEAEGIRCWIAPRDVPGGTEWAAAIVDAIDECRVMVVIFSGYANLSKQVHREVEHAFDGEKPVVPLRIEDVTPEKGLSYYMQSIHWLDALTPPLEQHLDKLTERVKAILQTPPKDSSSSVTLMPKKAPGSGFPFLPKELWKVAVALIALILLGAGAVATWTHFRAEAPATMPAPTVTRSQQILLNIVRASYGETPFSNVAADSNQAIHRPMNLQLLNLAIRENYPRELLFWLFADSFQLQPNTSPGSMISYQYNPPDSYGCPTLDAYHRCFREWIWLALLTGLTAEEQSILVEKSAKASNGTPEAIVVARFCFSSDLARQTRRQMGEQFATEVVSKYGHFSGAPSPTCGTWTAKDAMTFSKLAQPDTFSFPIGDTTVRVASRSVYKVFEFLGNQMKMKRDDIHPTSGKALLWPRSPMEGDEEEIPPKLVTVDGTPPLLYITTVEPKNASTCYVHARYNNVEYCVPGEADTTKRVFNFLMLPGVLPAELSN
jgi:hypothetical protein